MPDGSQFELKILGGIHFKSLSKTVGSVLMTTAIIWGILGYGVAPVYKRSSDGSISASLTPSDMDLGIASFSFTAPKLVQADSVADKGILDTFRLALEGLSKSNPVAIVNGKPMSEIAPSSATEVKMPNGSSRLSLELVGDNHTSRVLFDAKKQGKKIIFSPVSVETSLRPAKSQDQPTK